MKPKLEAFIDCQLWKLLRAIEHDFGLQHNHVKKSDIRKYILFELFTHLGYASVLIDGDGTPGWTITEHGLAVLRGLWVREGEDHEDKAAACGDKGDLRPLSAAELSYYEI